jgi:hypothetical protein
MEQQRAGCCPTILFTNRKLVLLAFVILEHFRLGNLPYHMIERVWLYSPAATFNPA